MGKKENKTRFLNSNTLTIAGILLLLAAMNGYLLLFPFNAIFIFAILPFFKGRCQGYPLNNSPKNLRIYQICGILIGLHMQISKEVAL